MYGYAKARKGSKEMVLIGTSAKGGSKGLINIFLIQIHSIPINVCLCHCIFCLLLPASDKVSRSGSGPASSMSHQREQPLSCLSMASRGCHRDISAENIAKKGSRYG